MSDCDEGDQRKVESTSRMWAESQPGPSRCQPSRQGYCGYCRVLYSNLDQHLSSLRHMDSVRASSRGSSTFSSSSSSRTKLTLLERFLQDVLQHHPHRYNDSRSSHADLPSVSAPLLPRAEVDELCFPDDDRRSLSTREHLSSSDLASCQPANEKEDDRKHSQSGEGFTGFGSQERLSEPIREQEEIITTGNTLSSQVQAPPPYHQAPPSVHRKAHRKTNRRKTSTSSTSSPPHRSPDPGPRPPTESRPWWSWQKERREAHKEEAFSSDHSDSLDRTIEEVIQVCCHGVSSAPFQQEEMESFHFSLPVSIETQSDDWDSPVQRQQTLGDTPVQVSQVGEQYLSGLMDVQVDLEDQVYSYQLDSALHSEARQDQGFWSLPIEEVLPAPEHIPESFRGKTWTQIEQEDEGKVEKLVQQFRRGRFICYFDTESLARYGRRSQNKGRGENKEAEPAIGVLPLLDGDDDDSAYLRSRRRKRRTFRVASRCQVVKVSHSTQTIRLGVPAVCEPSSEAPPTSIPPANQNAAERTPETWRYLPPSYSNIVTPVQPRTSLVYLLCSPSGSAPSYTPAPGSALKRCRKKRRPLDMQGLKVKYKQLPVRFYEPSSNRILKNPPRGSAPSSPPPPCVRQLFRSLSLDLNADRESAQNMVSRRGRTSQALPPERGRGGRRDRTRPPPSKTRTRAKATPPQPRREGLRSTGRGRSRRGQGYERGRS